MVSFYSSGLAFRKMLCLVAFWFVSTVSMFSQKSVTVIVHGFQLTGNHLESLSDFYTFARGIKERAGGANTDIYTNDWSKTGGWYKLADLPTPGQCANCHITDPATANIILVYNWATLSNDLGQGSVESAADHLFAALVSPSGLTYKNGNTTKTIDVNFITSSTIKKHFIGHSRGNVLLMQVLRRINRYFPDATIDHLTTLDPHPAEGSIIDDTSLWGIAPDPSFTLYPSYKLRLPANESDIPVVKKVDNYFRRADIYQPTLGNYSGVFVEGASSQLLLTETDLDEGCYSSRPHSNVHAWYFGTIQNYGYITYGDCDSRSFPDSWYPSGSRLTNGYNKSFLGGGYSSTTPPFATGIKVSTLNKNKPKLDAIFNGSFQYGTNGWVYNGGNNEAQRISSGRAYLYTIPAQHSIYNTLSIQHSLMFFGTYTEGDVAKNFRYLKLKYDATEVPSIRDLTITFKNASNGEVQKYSLKIPDVTSSTKTVYCPIPSELQQKVGTFKIEVSGLCKVSVSEIELKGCIESGANIQLMSPWNFSSSFDDLPSTSKAWYKVYAEYGAKKGLFRGINGNFRGEQKLTQGQAAKVVVEAAVKAKTLVFDLSGTPIIDVCNEFFPYIQTLYNKSIISSSFNADASIDVATFCHYIYKAFKIDDARYEPHLIRDNFRSVDYFTNLSYQVEASIVSKLVNIYSDDPNDVKYKGEKLWEFLDVSQFGGRVSSDAKLNGAANVTRGQMAKVITGAYAIALKAMPGLLVNANLSPETLLAEPTLAEMAIIGEKFDNAAIPVGNAPITTRQANYACNVGQAIDIYYPSETDNAGNPMYFHWSMLKNGANLTSQNTNNSKVRFTAPSSVTQRTLFNISSYVANNKGMTYEEFITITVDPVSGGTGTGIPTQNANSLNLYGETTTSISATWTRGNGQSCLVTCTELSGVPPDQPEYRIYSGNSNFANAPSVFSSSDSKVVYTGTGNNVTVTGLSPNTSYRFVVYEYNGSTDATVRYGFSGALPEQRATTLRTNIVTTTSDFTYPNTLIEGQSVTFTNTSANHTSSSWTINGGASYTPVNGGATCNIRFPTAGTYNVTLVTSNSATGQTVSTTKSVSVVTVASTLSDFAPQNLSLSASTITAGQSIVAKCYVNNSSTMAGSQSSNITFRLSTDQIFDDTDEGYGRATYTVNAGQSVLVTHNITISNTQATGQYYIVAKADDWVGSPNGLIEESNENNNTIAIPLKIQAALPDLMIQSVTIPITTIASGQGVSGSITVRNLGIVDLPYTAQAVAYLSIDNQFDPLVDIKIGGCYPNSLHAGTTVNTQLSIQPSFTMPNGNYYLFVAIDYKGSDYDGNTESNENNNLFLYPSQITIANPNQPTTQANNLQLSNVTSNGARLSWTRGNGQSCIVIARSRNNIPQITGDNKTYIANANYTLAQQINYGSDPNGIYKESKVVYDGTGTSVDVTGLNSNETYTFIVLEYNGTGITKDYLQTTDNNGISAHTLYSNNTSFTRISGAIVNSVTPTAVKFFDQNRGFQYRGDNIYAVTNDGGITWLQKKQLLSGSGWAKECWVGNSGTGWLALDDGDILKTNDFGNNWTRQLSPVNRAFNDIHFVDANTGYIACSSISGSSTYDGAILKTTNGGLNWSIITTSSQPIGSVYFLNAQLGWATTFAASSSANKIILKTTDGGQTWSRSPEIVINGCFGEVVDIHFTTPQKGIAIAYCGTLLRTVDGGSTWSVSTSLPTEYSFAKIEFVDSLVGYINRKNVQLAKTIDGGTTWSLIPIQTDDVTGNAIGLLSVLDANTVFVGGVTGILKTTTGGQTQAIKLNSLPQQTICSGNTLKLPVKATGTFDASNNFTVQLSNESGSFATPTILTTFTNVGNDSIDCALPNNLAQGSGYRIRVLSNNPALISDTTALLTINATPSASVAINATNGTQICVGTNATFQATATNGGTTPQYQWKLNGANVGTNAATFSSPALQNADALWVELRSNAACASVTPTPSAPLSMNVITVPTPFIQAIDNTLASSSSTGNQWFLNGQALTGATSQFYALTGSSQNGTYTVRVSQNGCSAISEPFVFTYAQPSILTQALSQTSYCAGASLKLPYFLNGSFNTNATYTVQLSNATGSFATPTTIFTSTTLPYDTIDCVLPVSLATGNAYRIRITANNPTAISDTTVALTITSTPSVSVSISALNGTSICTGTNVQFTATPINGGNTPLYQWKVNSNNVGLNQATYSNANLRDGDIVKVDMVSNALCAATTAFTSPALSMQVTTLPTPTIVASGNILASSALTGNQWFFNGQAIIGATNQFHTATQTGFYTVRVTTNNCTVTSQVFNHTITATNDLDKDQSFVKVYPNPTTGQFTIELQNNTSIKSEVTISNTLGQIILRQDLINNIGQFDVSSMTSGIYLIKIRTETKEIWRKLMIKH